MFPQMSSLIQLCFMDLSNSGHVEEAEKSFNDVLDRGIAPHVYAYNALIDVLCKEEKIHDAISLFKVMTDYKTRKARCCHL